MITAIVNFKLPAIVNRKDAQKLFEGSAPKYRNLPGLVRKYYLFGDGVGGGVYLWQSRAAAEKVYNADWKKMIADRYGAEPTIVYFDTPVIVDNDKGAIESQAAD